MASRDHNGDEQPSRIGYFAAILVSALGHAAAFAIVFFVAPRFLHPAEAAPPAYTVKIVDSLPAGDLGTHLPRINRSRAQETKQAAPKPEEAQVKTEPPKTELALEDKNALKINAKATDAPTATPTPEPTTEATATPTPAPTTSLAKPKPTPEKALRNPPKPESTVAKAKIASTPSVAQQFAKLKRELLAEHVKELEKNPPPEEDEDDDSGAPESTPAGPAGGGPVIASAPSEGAGYGVGVGKGSVGILQDPEFILYYKTVQEQIKKSWAFTGGSNDLTATVDFAIGPDGALAAVKIGTSSNDPAFDDSVIRAIRRAAPFPPPPEKFRGEFSSGIKALFKLGELKS